MLQQTKTYGKDEIVLEMDEQIRICHILSQLPFSESAKMQQQKYGKLCEI